MPDQVTEAMGTSLGTKPGTRPSDFVWARGDGQAISRHTTLKAFQTATASINRAGMVWRDLRHTADTLAADAGATRATLQTRMGHADPRSAPSTCTPRRPATKLLLRPFTHCPPGRSCKPNGVQDRGQTTQIDGT